MFYQHCCSRYCSCYSHNLVHHAHGASWAQQRSGKVPATRPCSSNPLHRCYCCSSKFTASIVSTERSYCSRHHTGSPREGGAFRMGCLERTWLWRFPLVLIAAGQVAQLRFVILLSDDKDYFFILYAVYVGMNMLLAGIALLHWPGADQLELVNDPDGYQVLADRQVVDSKRVCPEAKAGIFSIITFGWISNLMRQGYRAPLQFEDIWDLPPDDRVDVLAKRFRPIWKEQLERRGGPSLTSALWKFTRYLILTALPFKLVNDVSQFVGPTFLNLLLGVVSSGQPSSVGYTYAVLMLTLLIIGTAADNQHFQRVMRGGFRLRAMLVHEVFDKVLYLTPSARAQFSSGRIFNLVTTDAETLQMLFQNILGVISSPARIIGSMAMLYVQLGPSSLVALAVLILMMPAQAVLVRISARLLKKTLLRTDERAKLEGELLDGIDVVKCMTWENPFWDRIQKVRQTELDILWKSFRVATFNSFLLNAIPTFVSVATFTTYVLLGNKLTAAKAFTSLSLFSILRMPLFQLPQLISQLVNAQVAITRLREFLAAAEQHTMPETEPAEPGEKALHLQGDFTWEESAEPSLTNLDAEVKSGELMVVVGPTGSGKSSLLGAALGLMQQVSGEPVNLRGKVAYVPQSAFIYNASVRDNILFGLPFQQERYDQAIAAAAVRPDLDNMAAGDRTEMGERGINLSGGQKQRISIARAVYSDADVYLFDDPLSALDAKVAREVYNTCLMGVLKEKTRVLVTNQLQFVSGANSVVYMQDGQIRERGSYEELMKSDKGFAQLMSSAEVEQEEKDDEHPGDDAIDEDAGPSSGAAPSSPAANGIAEGKPAVKQAAEKTPKQGQAEAGAAGEGRVQGNGKGGNLTELESRATGKVSLKMLMVYVNAMGGKLRFSILMSWFLLVELCRVGTTVWLSFWTGIADNPGGAPHGSLWYLAIYAGISATQIVFQLSSTLLLKILSLAAARTMHNNMLKSLLRAPLSFFHVTPTGRIINRLTKDTSDVDKNLADFAAFFLRSCLQLTSTIILVGVTTPFALPFLVPILLLFYFLYQYFQASVREVKRLDSISRSPVYSSIGEAINGLPTIRAYRAEERLSTRNCNLVDNSVVMSLINQSMNRWLSVRLETLGALAAFSAAVLAIESRGAASQMGLTLSYALQITTLTSMTVRLASVAENAFNAVERIAEYSRLKEEAPAVIQNSAPADWPSAGKIEFKGVKMRYRPGLPLVLKGLDVCIEAGTTCGVVGRTGAGKTSVINTIFRLMELDQGAINIDGLDIAKLGLAQLRNSMAIIPQVPVLFTGTMRSNLDPFERHSDLDIWAALRRAHLARVVESNPMGLEMTLSEGGAPLSAGQKQLVALARALLRNSKILILDEATANVDVETDALIQKTVREEFRNRTIVAIAHRLHTIIDCDMVLVMDNGLAAEWGRPATLLDNPNGTFTSMVRETGHAAEQFLRSVAAGQADNLTERDQQAAAALQRVNTCPDWHTDCSAASADLVEKSQAAQKLLKVVIAGLSEDAHSEEVRKELGIDSFGEDGSSEENNAYQAIMQAVELLTDVNKLAAQARRFLTKNKPKPTAGPPSRSSVSSQPGTPPGLSSAGSLTSPLLSPNRTSREGDRVGVQPQALARSDSSGLGRRNMAGPFGTAAAQGLSGLQSYNSLPIPRAARISIDSRCDRTRPLPNLDELVPLDSASGSKQKWARMRKQLKAKTGRPSISDRHRMAGEDPTISNNPEYH
ncbi:hypothetical protein ABBQ32_010743 [Trebouxia sp. C0010 RCD-2024]